MKTIIVLGGAVLMAAAACGRAQGATDTGNVFAYTSRQQVQCYTATMSPELTEVIANCEKPEDLPLSGSCSNPGPGGGDAMLAVSHPLSWQGNIAGPAGWGCGWSSGGHAVYVPNAQATICCVVKSQ